MKWIAECDEDSLLTVLENVGIDCRRLEKMNPSAVDLQEFYGYLLHAQLSAWKKGTSWRTVIKHPNDALDEEKGVFNSVSSRGSKK